MSKQEKKTNKREERERVEVTNYRIGLLYMQVCAVAGATNAEILRVCNTENPSGTSQGWAKVHRPRTGKLAPIPCIEDPKRRHFLVSC